MHFENIFVLTNRFKPNVDDAVGLVTLVLVTLWRNIPTDLLLNSKLRYSFGGLLFVLFFIIHILSLYG